MEKIIGFCTGGSGSVSLSVHLDLWHEWRTTDRKFMSEDRESWLVSLDVACDNYHKNGDISLDHINSLGYWLSQDVTRIALLRGRTETIDSIRRHPDRIFKRLFPQFDFKSRAGIGKYYDWYYGQIFDHEDKFIIITPDQLPIVLNSQQAQNFTTVV